MDLCKGALQFLGRAGRMSGLHSRAGGVGLLWPSAVVVVTGRKRAKDSLLLQTTVETRASPGTTSRPSDERGLGLFGASVLLVVSPRKSLRGELRLTLASGLTCPPYGYSSTERRTSVCYPHLRVRRSIRRLQNLQRKARRLALL